jgi:hypothetical protein
MSKQGILIPTAAVAALADALLARAGALRWDATPALLQAGELCLLFDSTRNEVILQVLGMPPGVMPHVRSR